MSAAALPQRIAVVGGGIGGLAFAAGLLHFTKHGAGGAASGASSAERPSFEVTVFDQAVELKPLLGGGFKLDSGAAALREIGLEKEYLRYLGAAVCRACLERWHDRACFRSAYATRPPDSQYERVRSQRRPPMRINT